MKRNILVMLLLLLTSNVFANALELSEKYKDTPPVTKLSKYGKKLIKYVSGEQDVDKEKVILIKQFDASGQGIYIVRIDDNFYKYTRIGSVFSLAKPKTHPVNQSLVDKYKDKKPIEEKGDYTDNLISFVAQDLEVNESEVKLYKQHDADGQQGSYLVKVDGQFIEYKRIGSVFWDTREGSLF